MIATLSHSTPYAGFRIRFLAYVTDVYLFMTVFLLLCTLILINNQPPQTHITHITLLFYGLCAAWFIYFTYYESSLKQGTLGKQWANINVVSHTGQRLTPFHAAMRTLAATINQLTGGISYIIIAFMPKKTGAHDILARTYVIRGGASKITRYYAISMTTMILASIIMVKIGGQNTIDVLHEILKPYMEQSHIQ